MQYRPMAQLPKDLDDFTRAYLECAEWSGLDDEGQEALELSVTPKWSEDSLTLARADCKAFQDGWAQLIETDLSQAGHDFWLTRNRHGAGFWDGDWPKPIGDELTKASHAYGELNVEFDEDDATLRMF